MDCSEPAPRVNGELLGRYAGKKVLLVGRVEQTQGLEAQVRCADDRVVQVALSQTAGPLDAEFVEFEAIVDDATHVREVGHTNFGGAFDLPAYNELCKLSNGEFEPLFV